MNSCKEIKPILEKYIVGDISKKEMTVLENHTKQCNSCREMMAIHTYILKEKLSFAELETLRFEKMHQNIFHEIKNKNGVVIERIISYIRQLFPRPAIAVSFATVMLIAGTFIPGLLQDSEQVILGQIKQVAYTNKSFKDVENSPYIFENVKFKTLDGDRVALSFDLVTHLDIVRPTNDPIVKEALAQSLLTSQGIGGRLKAISLSKEVISPKIKETLIYTMLNDQNIAVRFKTMESLQPYKKDQDVQQAFLNVLQKEESVQMRMLAIEYLTGEKNSSNAVMKELGGKNEIIKY